MNCKKIILSVASVIFCTIGAFSAAPKWLSNIEAEFPSEEYIRALGEGDNEDLAKEFALSELSAYFSQKIKTDVKASRNISNTNSKHKENSEINQNINISTNVELFSVEYTNSFYDKKRKTYYICAYINKSEFWEVLSSKMNTIIKVYERTVQMAELEDELFQKMIDYNRCEKLISDFNSYYERALVMNPKKCTDYSNFLDNSTPDLAMSANLKKRITIQIIVNNDRNNKIRGTIAELISNNGMKTVSLNGMYTLVADIDWNETELNNIFSSTPQIEIQIERNNNIVASFSGRCEKFAAKNYDITEKTATARLEKLLEEHFISDCLE